MLLPQVCVNRTWMLWPERVYVKGIWELRRRLVSMMLILCAHYSLW